MRLPSLILAAGCSRRMGQPKLSLPLGSGVLISPVLDLATGVSGKENVFVVLRPEAEKELWNEVESRGLHVVTAEHAAKGQAESLKAGVQALQEFWKKEECHKKGMAQGVLVFLADQPCLQPETVLAVVRAFDGQNVLAPSFEGRRGHPVILPRRAFEAVSTLKGDTGAKEILQAFGLRLVPTSDRAVLHDVDTPEAYAACRAAWNDSLELFGRSRVE